MKRILIGILMMAVICLINPMSAIADQVVGVDADGFTWSVTDEFAQKHFESGTLNNFNAKKHLLARNNVTTVTSKNSWPTAMDGTVNTIIKKNDLETAIRNLGNYRGTVDDDNRGRFTVTISGISAAARRTNNYTDWSIRCATVSDITIDGRVDGRVGQNKFLVDHLQEAAVASTAPECS
ncbi:MULTISPECIES: hypothetical protein [Aerosakkonema]|uniref:hypothetical protein n=1 Tax=Aerosakkonema TaxID=1246629 RepID=UPI0035BBE05D